MLVAIAILLSLAFIVWLIRLAVKKKPVRAHMVMYMLSWLTGVFVLAFLGAAALYAGRSAFAALE